MVPLRFRFGSAPIPLFPNSNCTMKIKRYPDRVKWMRWDKTRINEPRNGGTPVSLQNNDRVSQTCLETKFRNQRPMLAGKRCRLSGTMQADRKYRTFQNTVQSETLPIQIFEFRIEPYSGRFCIFYRPAWPLGVGISYPPA